MARSATFWSWALRPGSSAPGVRHHQQAERGQTLAEYSLLLGLVGISAIVSLAALGSATDGMFWEPINRVLGEVVAMLP